MRSEGFSPSKVLIMIQLKENLFSRIELVKPKSQPITEAMVVNAWKRVNKSSKGKGVDEVSFADFEKNKSDNLYKIYNRMSSGSYFPPPVREIEILKPGSEKKRVLGVATIGDRVAQKVVSTYLEELIDSKFDESSYSYRQRKNAQQAISQCKENCWRYSWVVDLDVKGFFDNIDRNLLMDILREHTDEKWILMYVERWLNAPFVKEDGTIVQRDKGTPQGGVVSPVLANMYLDKVFDKWFRRYFPELKFERYADDIIIHCYTQKQASYILDKLKERLTLYKLEIHPVKTKIVYCKQSRRQIDYPINSFKFVGIQFRPVKSKDKRGRVFQGFSTVVPMSSTCKIGDFIKGLKLQRKTQLDIHQIAKLINNRIRGWINYFKDWDMHTNCDYFFYKLNARLVKWAMNRYKRLQSKKKAYGLIKRIQQQKPDLFEHWRYGFRIGGKQTVVYR